MKTKGKIINIGSLSGEYGGPRTPSYAAKAGVMSLTHCLARLLGAKALMLMLISVSLQTILLKKRCQKSKNRKSMLLIKRFGKLED